MNFFAGLITILICTVVGAIILSGVAVLGLIVFVFVKSALAVF